MTKENFFSLDNENLNSLLIERGKDCLATELDGEVVLLDLATDNFVGLDAVGSSVWNLLEQPTTFSALCQALIDEYDVEEYVCRDDVLEFLKDLADNGLITAESTS